MTLTVPRAGVVAGAAPQLRAVPPSEAGAAVAQLGEAVAGLGGVIEQERLGREEQQLQLDLTRDLGRARLEFEQMTDPDQIDTLWPQRVQEIRDRYFEGVRENGRPIVDPKLRSRADLAFQELSDRHALALAGNAVALRHGQREATFIEYRQEVTTQAAAADPATRETLVAQAEAQIDALLAAGTIGPAEAAQRKVALRGDVTNASAITLIDTDPVGFIEAADAGEFDALGAEGLARARVTARNEIARREAAAAAEQEKATQQQARAINDELRQITAVTAKGRTPAQLAMLGKPDVRALADPEVLAEADAAAALFLEQPNLDRMPLDRLEELIEEERGKAVARDYEAGRLTVLEGLYDRKAKGLTEDWVAFAREEGLAFAEPLEFDPADELGFRAALKNRVTEAGLYARRENLRNPGVPLSADEVEALRARASVTTDPRERAVLARSLAAELGDEALSVVGGQTDDGKVFAHMGAFLAAGGTPALAERAFRGQQVLDANNLQLPPLAQRLDPQFGIMADVLDQIGGGEYRAEAIRLTADAIYAEANRGKLTPRRGEGGVAGDIDPDAYSQALHEAMGGTGTVGDRTARGGVQQVREALTVLPRGVAADAVEDALDRLGIATTQAENAFGMGLADIEAFDPATLDRQLKAASRAGTVPRINGRPLDERTLRALQPRAVGNDLYVFINPDTDEVIEDESGGEFVFRLSRLVRP